MEIPLRNIYYILSYAWKYFKFNDLTKLDKKDFNSPTEFFAEIFDLCLGRYVKKGLKKNYVQINEELKGIKSKVDFSMTIKTNGFRLKKFYCTYDDFTENNIINQVIKFTLLGFLKANISIEQKSSLKRKLVFFGKVDNIIVNNYTFSKVKYTRDNFNLNFLINICKYVYSNSGFDEKSGEFTMSDFSNSKSMPMVFENFILNFYKEKLDGYKVRGGEHIKWKSESINSLYPVMKTDITIRGNKKTYVIDTKFKKDVFQNYYDTPKFNSSNIYQIYTYLDNFQSENGELEGMLLYPTTHTTVRDSNTISGKTININTINLNQEWKLIENELLELIEPQ